MKKIFYFILFVIFSGCAITSDSLNNSKTISKNFTLGQSNKYSEASGLWYTKYYFDPKVGYQQGDAFEYLLIFEKPTEIATNENFIILKRGNEKHSKYKIIKIENGDSLKFYTRNKLSKYLKLRTKLGVPDSLKLIPIGTISDVKH